MRAFTKALFSVLMLTGLAFAAEQAVESCCGSGTCCGQSCCKQAR